MKCRRIFLSLIILTLFLFFSGTASAAEKGTSITVTFAAGGVACGIYFIFYVTTGYGSDRPFHQIEQGALFTGSRAGWKVGYPEVKLIQQDQSTHIPCVEILKFQF